MNDSKDSVRVALEARARLGEGPIWDDLTQSLYWVDIYNYRVHQFFPDRGALRTFDVGETVGCLAVVGTEKLLVGLRHHLAYLDTTTGEIEQLVAVEEDKPRNRFNDGKCDPQGRFWAGTMSREEGKAALYRYDPDGSLQVMEKGLTVANGLGWSPDGKTFYHTDSPEKTIFAYDFDGERGEISNRRVFAKLDDGDSVPDGLAVDAEGYIWSAQWDGWCLIRLDPDGREERRVEMPVKRPTSCMFGGPERRTLFITSAAIDQGEEEIEENIQAGDLFRLDVEVEGLPVHRFGG